MKLILKEECLYERTRILMRIILPAYEDFVVLENKKDVYGEVIKEILKKDYAIHNETIKYWACEIEEEMELEDCFAITSFIRSIRAEE